MKVSAVQKAYEYIYNGILDKTFPLGSPISELEISVDLNISRSPVREAIKRLEAEGLVICHPNRGTFVVDYTRQDMEEIFELRLMFEEFALSRACEYMDPKIIDELEQEILSLDKDSDISEYLGFNQHLHRAIISNGGNGRMMRFFRVLAIQLNVINRITTESPENLYKVKEEHLKIIKAIKDRDYELAHNHLKAHLQAVLDRTIKVYFGSKSRSIEKTI